MRALELRSYDAGPDSLVVVERPVPRPQQNQVLIRIAASPVNPSDLMFLRGLYGVKKELPVVPGFEGSGRVVEAGGGLFARYLKGKRVACAASPEGDGTWAEYMVTEASHCIPLRRATSLEQAAMMIVNPLTAYALMDKAVAGHHLAVVQTAAASALGQMIQSLGRRFQIPVINIVRRQEQVELLEQAGSQYTLNSSTTDFDERLRELCRKLKATLAFDAVAGEMTGRVMQAMSKGATAIVYGALSEGACMIDPRSLIFEGKALEGFWLSSWLRAQSAVSMLRVSGRVQKLLDNDLKTEVRARLPLEEATRGLQEYSHHMTGGKILFVPGLRKEGEEQK
jgi:NADPH2:quinone reductase